jgi:uncharacterized membrane protein YkoI
MPERTIRPLLSLVMTLAVVTPMPVHASDLLQGFAASPRASSRSIERPGSDNPFDREDVGKARRAGDILPMWEVIRRLGPDLQGQVVATDIVERSGRWLYQFQLLRGDGTLVRVWADARSGTIVGPGQ